MTRKKLRQIILEILQKELMIERRKPKYGG